MLVGKVISDFTLKDKDKYEHTLSRLDSKYIVLFFYPKDLTTGCSLEACDFRDYNKEFENLGTKVIGIGRGDSKFVGKGKTRRAR